ncbi:MAG: response regulator, partial [Balneolaceae bacterium]
MDQNQINQKYLLQVLEKSLNEIYIFDFNHLKFTYVNKGALSNIGFSMDEMASMTPMDIKPDFTRTSFMEMVQPLINKKKENIIFETVHKRKDGSLYDVEVHLQLVEDVANPFFESIVLDITNRRTIENEIFWLNQSLELKVEERTASMLAYQNQLRSLAYEITKTKENERKKFATFLHDNLGQVLAISKMELDRVQQDEIPPHLKVNLERVAGLVSDAIRYTRELMSDLRPIPSANNDGLIANLNWLVQLMKKYGLEVKIQQDKKPKPLTEEIRNLVIRSVRELLFNVVKHGEVDKAELYVTRHKDQVQVVVSDKGKGFVPFPQKIEPNGLHGFGLFDLKEQVEWLNSSMEIDSKPGKGTNVVLRFPVHKSESSGTKETEMKSDEENFKEPKKKVCDKISVIIADDHPMMRTGLRKLIEEQDDLYVIAEASNGKEAVDLAHLHSPDIIIMDINMPIMDGIEATRQIKKQPLQTRIIALSFHRDENVSKTILDAGASIYVTKSEVFETLCSTVRSEGMVLRKRAEIKSR